jgi:hypothetical protein
VPSAIQDASSIEPLIAQAIDLPRFIRWWLQAAMVQQVYLTVLSSVLFVCGPTSEKSTVTRLSV